MKSWIGRLVLAVWFVGMVVVAVRGIPAQGQGEVSGVLHFPTIFGAPPPLHDYIGLVEIDNDYYTVRGDGSDFSLLADDTLQFGFREWSPDGRYFAYKAPYEGKPERAWLVDLATRQPRLLLDVAVFRAAWSPDGRRLAIVESGLSSTKGLHIYDVETNHFESYPLPTTPSFTPLWSPNSRHLAWLHRSRDGEVQEMWVWGGTGTEPRVVRTHYRDEESVYHPDISWSPDSTRLAYSTHHNGISRTYVTDGQANDAMVLVEGYSIKGWVEGGQRVALRGAGNLYLARADGSDVTLFADATVNVSLVSISPDGRWVAFSDDVPIFRQRTAILPPTSPVV